MTTETRGAVCLFVHREACCPHRETFHVRERVLAGDPDAASFWCEPCNELEGDWIETNREKRTPFPDAMIDSEHRYRAALLCGKPEHAALYPDEPHARIYGHDFTTAREPAEVSA